MNSGSKGLIHIVYNDFGIEAGQNLLDDLTKYCNSILVQTGFSVGIGDLVADSKTNEKIKSTIIKTKKQVSKLTQQVHQQIFENVASETLNDEFEKKVNNLLMLLLSEAGKIGLKSLDRIIEWLIWFHAGSKGKLINIAPDDCLFRTAEC